jgi:hypothetical protein
MAVKTHKEFDQYATGFKHSYEIGDVPREPAAFTPVPPPTADGFSHFTDRMRDLPGDKSMRSSIVASCITDGDLYKAEGDNRFKFIWTDPVFLRTYILIVELREVAFRYGRSKHFAVTVFRFEH